MSVAQAEAIGFFPTTTGMLCTIITASHPTQVLVGVWVKTAEGKEFQMVWQPKEALHRLDIDQRTGILNVELLQYTEAEEEAANVRFAGRTYANVVGFDQLC